MTGHQQALDDLALDHVPLDDLGHIRLASDPVPRAFGIDDHAGPVFAMIEAPRFVRAHRPFEPQPLDLFLEEGMQPFRSLRRAAAARIVLRPLIDADEDMMREGGHGRGYPAVAAACVWRCPSSALTSAAFRSLDPDWPRIVEISRSRSCARWSCSGPERSELCPDESLSNSALMSRKSRCKFLCIEQLSQYHFGL